MDLCDASDAPLPACTQGHDTRPVRTNLVSTSSIRTILAHVDASIAWHKCAYFARLKRVARGHFACLSATPYAARRTTGIGLGCHTPDLDKLSGRFAVTCEDWQARSVDVGILSVVRSTRPTSSGGRSVVVGCHRSTSKLAVRNNL